MIRLQHQGDLGDVIASLPILRALGGGDIVISESKFKDRGRSPRETMRGARYEAIRPLLLAQPYVTGVEWQDEPQGITHDLSHFRQLPFKKGENLATWQARYVGVEIDLDPWLTVPDFVQHDKTVIARSLRYHNFFFPWPELIVKNAPVVFVGLPTEHVALQKETHWNFPHQPTANLLELAMVIRGAKLFIGNQSAPYWIAAGLGMPLIQESFEFDPNSIVQRPNCVYTPDGPTSRTLIMRLYPRLTPKERQSSSRLIQRMR
jgi:hypothetical protein